MREGRREESSLISCTKKKDTKRQKLEVLRGAAARFISSFICIKNNIFIELMLFYLLKIHSN